MKQIKIVSLILSIMLMVLALPMGITATAATSSWNGTTITQPTSMKTIGGVYYYEISTAEELAYIAKTGDDWLGYNYILANDITLNSVELTYDANGNLTANSSSLNQWIPINNFEGIFDGNGYTIYGVYVDSSTDAAFLVNNNSNRADSCKKVVNLTLSNSYIRGSNAAGICESATQGIENCFFYGAVVGDNSAAGICLDTNTATNSGVANCINYGNIYSSGCAAGIANSASGLISNCANYGSISSKSAAAGICNQTSWSGNISNCLNYGTVKGVSKVAGIVSDADTSYVESCQNVGDITGNSYVGGICGHAQYMNIFSDTAITNSFNTGNIEGVDYIGGICGYVSQAYVDACYNTGNIDASGDYVGGIIGYLKYGDCKNSINVGYIKNSSLNSETGALIGHSQSIWGDGVVSGCQYIKTDTINTTLVAFGNATADTDGATSKDGSFFCVNSDKTLNKNGHTYSSTVPCDATCDNCGYERTVTHTYDNVKYDLDKHWYECDCGEVKPDSEESHTGGTATCTSKAKCDVCKQAYGVFAEHNFDETSWGYKNADGHAHVCQTSGCSEHDTVVAHTSSGAATEDVAETCTECGYIISPALGHKKHTAKTEWITDDKYHWHECTGCEGQQLDKSSHKDLDNNAKCDTCGATVPVGTVGESDEDVNSDGDGLSGGAIAGIAVGSTAVVGIGGFSLIWFVIKKKSWADLLVIFKK